jgi:hypothetical protein
MLPYVCITHIRKLIVLVHIHGNRMRHSNSFEVLGTMVYGLLIVPTVVMTDKDSFLYGSRDS